MLHKVVTQTVINRFCDLLLIGIAAQQPLFAGITDKTRFDKDRRDIRRTQYAEAGVLRTTLM